jgi:hypothetical protein
MMVIFVGMLLVNYWIAAAGAVWIVLILLRWLMPRDHPSTERPALYG